MVFRIVEDVVCSFLVQSREPRGLCLILFQVSVQLKEGTTAELLALKRSETMQDLMMAERDIAID